jgi:hypothetical protein
MDKVFNTAVTSTSTTQKEELGIVRWESGRAYRYILAGAAIAQYDALIYSGTTGYTVIPSTSANGTEFILGAAQVAIANGSYGWMQVYGPGVVKSDATHTAGIALTDGAGVGTVRAYANTDICNIVGLALATGVTAGSAVFFTLL